METKRRAHPSNAHLAALALGELAPDSSREIREHVEQCSDCSDYLSGTNHADLVAELKRHVSRTAAEQNTRAASESGTLTGLDGRPHDGGSSQPSIPPELQGQTKYRVLRQIGRGGMGTVYEAEHVRMGRKVAIKVINHEFVDHPQAVQRFEQEVKSVASLDHPNIVRAYDAESFGSLQAIVMEFVPGRTLDEILKVKDRLTVPEACRCIRQSLFGLQHAHESGLVHRDLKPHNLILATETGIVKILDFGLAKAASENRLSRGLTRSHMTMGTYEYMAPEQALDAAKADIRADIYSLGCSLYYLVSGRLPFQCDSDAQLLLAHQNETPRPLSLVCPDVPEALSLLVARMLAKSPADRPQTPKEAADALLPFAQGKVVVNTSSNSASRPKIRQSRRRLIPMTLIACGLLGLLAWGSVLLVRTPHGTIVIEGVPSDASLLIDGDEVAVTRDGETLRFSSAPTGPHRLRLERNGVVIWTNDAVAVVGGESLHFYLKPQSREGDDSPEPAGSDADLPALSGQDLRTESEFQNAQPRVASKSATVVSGVWVTEGDEIRQTDLKGKGNKILFGEPNWTDYDFSFKARATGGASGFKAVFRARDDSFYLFACGLPTGMNEVAFVDDGRPGRNQGKTSAPGSVEEGAAYAVRVEVRGDEFRCYLNDKLILTDSHPRFTAGRVGLGTWESTAAFWDIEVKSPQGDVLWSGLPVLPGAAALQPGNAGEDVVMSKPDVGESVAVASPPAPSGHPPEVTGDLKIRFTDNAELSAQRGGSIVFGDPNWTEYDVSFSALFVKGPQFTLHFNHQDADNLRLLNIGGGHRDSLGSGVRDWCDLATCYRGIWDDRVRVAESRSIDRNRWYRFRVSVRGADCQTYLDDSPWLANHDDRFTAGRVGIWLPANCVVKFHNFQIRSADGTALLDGIPAPPPSAQPLSPPAAESKSPSGDPVDVFAERSVWKGIRENIEGALHGSTPEYWLYVDSASAGAFAGRSYHNGPRRNRAVVEGTIQGTVLQWTETSSTDVAEFHGSLGSDGATIHFEFQRRWTNGATQRGRGQLNRTSFDAERRTKAASNSEQATPQRKYGPRLSRAALSSTGEWQIEGDELVASSSGGRSVFFGDPQWSDVDFSYDVLFESLPAMCAGRFRVDGNGASCHFGMGMFGGSQEWSEIGFEVDNKWNGESRNGRRLPLEAGKWYSVRIVARGSKYVAYVDNKEFLSTVREGFPTGCVGLVTNKAGAVRFRNVLVTDPEGIVLWEGFPEPGL